MYMSDETAQTHWADEPDDDEIFTSLPAEILENIFSRLDADFLLCSVRVVCKRFCTILTNETFWKLHFLSRNKAILGSKAKYPLLTRLGLLNNTWKCALDLQWRDMAVHLDTSRKRWITGDFETQRLSGPHSCPVDALRILKGAERCVSGSRDGLLAVWDTGKKEHLSCYVKAHNGWIWDLDSYENESFFSCGWDSLLCFWKLTPTGPCRSASYRFNSPALRVACKRGLVALGILDRPRVALVDPRVMESDYRLEIELHKAAITAIKLKEHKLITASEDKTISIYDIRMKKVLNENIRVSLNESYPRSLGLFENLIFVGDSRGNIHILDEYDNYNNFQVLQLNAQHVTAVLPKCGSLIVGSTDKTLRFVVPTNPYKIWKEIPFKDSVISVDALKNIIAVGTSDNSVTFLNAMENTFNY